MPLPPILAMRALSRQIANSKTADNVIGIIRNKARLHVDPRDRPSVTGLPLRAHV